MQGVVEAGKERSSAEATQGPPRDTGGKDSKAASKKEKKQEKKPVTSAAEPIPGVSSSKEKKADESSPRRGSTAAPEARQQATTRKERSQEGERPSPASAVQRGDGQVSVPAVELPKDLQAIAQRRGSVSSMGSRDSGHVPISEEIRMWKQMAKVTCSPRPPIAHGIASLLSSRVLLVSQP